MNDVVQIISILGNDELLLFPIISQSVFADPLSISSCLFLNKSSHFFFLKQEFISSFIGSLAKKQHEEQARRPHIRKWLKAQTQARH